jgi:hypothetical protein
MNKEKQAQLISEIGEMIINDPRYISNPWQSIAIVITLCDRSREMSSYRYLENGSFQAGSPNSAGAILRKFRDLKKQMETDGDGSFLKCLIHITKPDYNIRLQFEFDNPERWKPKTFGMDMSEFANLLRPE